MRMRLPHPLVLGIVVAVACLAGLMALAIAKSGADDATAAAGLGSGHTLASTDLSASQRAAAIRAATHDAQLIRARSHRAQAVEPEAGVSSADAGVPSHDAPTGAAAGHDPAPTAPASGPGTRRADIEASDGQISFSRAGSATTAAVDQGMALPPLGAPDAITSIIQAGNQIARTPYLWGGGHGKWLDSGYDCSGSVSYALAAAGYLKGPLTSGQLANWGDPGPGKWVTIYANATHVWMTVAGIRFDTSGRDSRNGGSRWQPEMRSTAGFVQRHPPGL